MSEAATLDPRAGRWLHGTRQVIEFNWPKYAMAGGILAVVAAMVLNAEPGLARALLIAAAIPVAWWTVASIAVSWWVYDASGLTSWSWLRAYTRPRRWANVHCGFDETSQALAGLFPASVGTAVDVFTPGETTEHSIVRARRRPTQGPKALSGSPGCLPLPSDSQDAVFLLFAAHELRAQPARISLFCEARRVLAADGVVVLVEHLRNLASFLAFGPGFLHFWSDRTWRQSAGEAGLKLHIAKRAGPGVAVYVWRR